MAGETLTARARRVPAPAAVQRGADGRDDSVPRPRCSASPNQTFGGRCGSQPKRASASTPTTEPVVRSATAATRSRSRPGRAPRRCARADVLVGGRLALLGEVVVDRRLERRVVQLEAAVRAPGSRAGWPRSGTSVRSNGLVRKSLAPASRARSRTSALASAVSTRTGRNPSSGTISCSESMTAKPSRCGMCRSSRTRSGSDLGAEGHGFARVGEPVDPGDPGEVQQRVSSVTLAAVSSTTTTVDVTSTPFMLGICAVAADMSGRVRRSPKVIARPSSRRGDGAPRARRSAS